MAVKSFSIKDIKKLLQHGSIYNLTTSRHNSTTRDDPIVETRQGIVQGTSGKDYDGRRFYKFLGIPYAKAPIGSLRFKPPQAPDTWVNIRNATKDGKESYSRDFFRGIVGSEDCLFLNVYTPEVSKPSVKLKPVMVFIHGGGFVSGSSNSEIYGPEFLLTEDVIVVTLNYRLGVLGFLAFNNPALNVSGNAGCKDIIMALKWVQHNIKNFGGDPNNVTAFGQSAGGAVVHLLMLSPMAKGLFHRVIAQSGSALNPWTMCKSPLEDLVQILNCPYKNEEDILRYLQDMPVHKLFQGQEKIRDRLFPKFRRSIGPVVENISVEDGAFINRQPVHIITEGSYNKVPLMMGYTSREAFFLTAGSQKLSKKDKIYIDFERYIPNFVDVDIGSKLSKDIAEKLRKFYFGDVEQIVENRDRYYLLQGDPIFVRGVYSSVKNHILTTTPIYLYKFSVDASLNIYKILRQVDLPGAGHCDDLGYLFKSPFVTDIRPNSVEDKTIRRIVKMWANFARTGNPNPVEDVTWKPVSRDEFNFFEIGRQLVGGVNPDKERMEFWDEIFKLISPDSKF